MINQPARLLTLKMVSEHLNVPGHRLEYALRTRGIEARVRLGGIRLFHRDQLEEIKAVLAETAKPHRTPNIRNDWEALVDDLCADEQAQTA